MNKNKFYCENSRSIKNPATENQVENALDFGDKSREKLQLFNFSYFIGKSYFDDDGSQGYLIFQLIFKIFKIFARSIDKCVEMKSKGCWKKISQLILH